MLAKAAAKILVNRNQMLVQSDLPNQTHHTTQHNYILSNFTTIEQTQRILNTPFIYEDLRPVAWLKCEQFVFSIHYLPINS